MPADKTGGNIAVQIIISTVWHRLVAKLRMPVSLGPVWKAIDAIAAVRTILKRRTQRRVQLSLQQQRRQQQLQQEQQQQSSEAPLRQGATAVVAFALVVIALHCR